MRVARVPTAMPTVQAEMRAGIVVAMSSLRSFPSRNLNFSLFLFSCTELG